MNHSKLTVEMKQTFVAGKQYRVNQVRNALHQPAVRWIPSMRLFPARRWIFADTFEQLDDNGQTADNNNQLNKID